MAVKRFEKKDTSFPGIENNNSSETQKFILSQIYYVGQNFAVTVGGNPGIDIKLGGAARRLFGLVLYVQNSLIADDDTFSVSINNENVIQTSLWRAFNPQANNGNPKDTVFFPLPRPLSGSDKVTISWNAVNAKQVYTTWAVSESKS